MSENRAVAYKGPGVVEVIDIDYPTFELKDGPGVNPANVGRTVPHGVIVKTPLSLNSVRLSAEPRSRPRDSHRVREALPALVHAPVLGVLGFDVTHECR
jgi:hypothetical protein